MKLNLIDKISIINASVLEGTGASSELKIMEKFVKAAVAVLEADYGFSFIWNSKKGHFEPFYKGKKTPYNIETPRKRGITSRVFKNLQPVYISHTGKNSSVRKDAKKFMKGVVVIPIAYKNKRYGTIDVCFYKQHRFTKQEKILSERIGSSAAQAITISRLLKSERKALQQSEYHQRRFRALIENSYDAIMLIEPGGKIIYASPSVRRMSGYTSENLQGHYISEYVHYEDMNLVKERMDEILENSTKTFTLEFRYKNSEKEWGWMEATCVNMLNNPSVGAIVANVRDITKRKMIEEQEKALVAQKEEFFSIASHELKTPVTVIKGFAQLLAATLPPEQAEAKKFTSKINYNIDKVNRLIGDFLDVSVLHTGKLKFLNTKFELHQFLKEKIEDLKMVITDHPLSFGGKGEFWVEGDMERVSQVVNNLVTNAAKYSELGTAIKVRLTKSNGYAKIEVEDFGVGIPEKYHNKVFQRFFQAKKHQSPDVYHGLGLGLYISSLIVRHHGGILDFKSKTKGTIFYFTIPYNNNGERASK